MVGGNTRDGLPITGKDEGHVLIVSSIYTLCEIPRSLCHGDDLLFDENHIIIEYDLTEKSVLDIGYFAATVSLTPISGTVLPTTAAICRTCFMSSSN